ncbi:DNA repair protein complementing XP-C cells homolog [Anopheles albimanus]|nr:DNA repair protein complementing XP-C cells homolog [Anopheles albimanus]
MDTEEKIYDEVEQEDSSAADFSASEDEWTPEQTKEPAKKPVETKKAKGKPPATAKKPVIPAGPVRVSRRIAAKKGVELPEDTNEHVAAPQLELANESTDEETDEEEKKETKRKAKRKSSTAKRAPAKRQTQKCSIEDEPIKLTTFTVEQLYRKYRPDLSHPAIAPAQPSTSKAASKAAKQPKTKDGDDLDSESSGDDYLVDPSELDLSSDFFRPTKQEREQRQAVDLFFDCNAGVELTDSEDEEADGVPSASKRTAEPKPVKDTDVELGMKLLQQVNQSTEALAQIKRIKETQTNASASAPAKKHAASNSTHGKMDPKLENSHRDDIASILHVGEKLAKHCGKSLVSGIGGRSDFVAVPSLERSAKPKDIEITLKPAVTTDAKGKKRTFDVLSALKRFMNREKRNSQIHLHKLSLLCWIGHGTYVNNELRKPSLMRFAQKKLLPGAMSHATRPNGLTNLRYFQELTRYFRRTVLLKDETMFYRQRRHPTVAKFLIFAIAKRAAYCKRDYILLFVLMLRSLGVYCRLVLSPPVPPKTVPPGQLYKMSPRTGRELAMERQLLYDFREAPADSMVHMAKEKLRAQIAKQSDRKGGASEGARKRKLAVGFSIPQLDGGADDIRRGTESGGSKEKKLRLMSGSFLKGESNRSKTVAPQRPLAVLAVDPLEEVRRRRARILEAYRARAAKLLASKKKQAENRKAEDSGKKIKANEKGKLGVDYWVEVFCEHEDKWITIDVLNGSVYNLEDIVKQATQPIAYVLAWNNDGSVKDVSPRYISRFGSIKGKLRIEDEWLERALKPYRGQRTKRDIIEDIKFDRLLNKRPFPEQIAEYRNHPKYAIERFLRRNEAIYPPDAPIVSRIRGEPIYLRSCIYTLQSRDGWLRQAKTVRMHEQPYKVVSARAKYDRVLGTSVTGQTVELFGEWQVEDYVPPVAKDGLVPRTAYGNVDLFKPCMLPKGTVHLQLPGLNRICRRLRIDCAQAITGFEYRSGGCQAVYDGFVVCEEFRERLLDEWYQEQVELERKEQERRRERIHANWRRLIVGLRIRKKLKDRYNFDNM